MRVALTAVNLLSVRIHVQAARILGDREEEEPKSGF